MSVQNALTFLQKIRNNTHLQQKIIQSTEENSCIDWQKLAAPYELQFSNEDFYSAFRHDYAMRQFYYSGEVK